MIEVEHLTKQYGTHTAVSDLSFRVGSGRIYGFLGPNGAGKSTTMNIMTGCLSATEGHVRIDGYDIFEQPDKAKRLIGYLPEQPPLYLNETPAEYLQFVGEAKGLRGEALKGQIAAVIRQTKIADVAHRKIAALSKGYRQRVGIAQALLGDPKVIILDEPTVGLDPLQIIEIRELIRELGQTHTVIFSSHILSEVQAICDEILIISKGRLIAFDTAENLEKLLVSSGELALVCDGPAEAVQKAFAGVPHITELTLQTAETGEVSARLKTDLQDVHALSRAVFRTCAAKGIVLLEMSAKKADLEKVFLELMEAETPDGWEENTADSEAIDAPVDGAPETRDVGYKKASNSSRTKVPADEIPTSSPKEVPAANSAGQKSALNSTESEVANP